MSPVSAPPAAIAARDDDRRQQAVCFHCGLPNPPRSRWRAVIDGRERAFCCAGCRGVAETIHAAGLDAFYAQRTAAADRPPVEAEVDDEWLRWDDAAQAQGLVRDAGSGHRETSLLLEGIHCGACIWLLETWLGRTPGVVAAQVNYATRRARVVWDPQRTRLSAILRAIARIGYHGYPYDPARREALAQRESRALLLRMAVALLAMMQVMMFAVPTYITVDGVEPQHRLLLEWASLTLTLPALLYSAVPFFRGAWRDLRVRRPGMDVPVALGLVAAFGASAWSTFHGEGAVYYDSVTMFIALLLLARYVELTARRRAGDAVETVAKARPATAERLPDWPASRAVEAVGAAALRSDDVVLVRPGATVPADGVVLDGRAEVEEAILTGESRPRARGPGDAVLAGSVARDGALTVRVTAAGEATRLAAIERLVERAAGERPRVARVADRVATWFVSALLALAAVTALVWWQVDPSRALAVTFALLVVSCPCALSLATPAALAAASGALGRLHVVIARADALETLAKVTHVVLDKTGTLTSGRVDLVRTVVLAGWREDEARALAAALEAHSEHALARALRATAAGLALPEVAGLETLPGEGVAGTARGRAWRLGRPAFVAALSRTALPPEIDAVDAESTLVALGDGEGIAALFVLGDTLRPGAAELVARLADAGITSVLLSGDRSATVRATAARVGIDDARGDALPEDKRAAVETLQRRGAVVAMVGDGINDAPSLAQAQVSLSLGSATPLAQWTADVVVLSDDLRLVAAAIRHAQRTLAVVRQNLGWAFAYNAVAIPAAALGHVTPLLAAIGMSASSLVVVLNALRVARIDGTSGQWAAADGGPSCTLPVHDAPRM
ncbi:MAG: heavy metal translocating P-type ATPase [Betaproteobacteria bacterium]|nr:heavy metal translocating P-type ATPase [Betaproteobacteria bacterium]